MRKLFLPGIKAAVIGATLSGAIGASHSAIALDIELLSTYRTGMFDAGGAEIVDFHPVSSRMFVVNGADKTIDMIDISTPSKPDLVRKISLHDFGKTANSVAVVGNLVVAAIENTNKQGKGKAVFFDFHGNVKTAIDLCALPDMVKATPNGRHVLFACEGEPNDAYNVDPEGQVAIIDIAEDGTISSKPRYVNFRALDSQLVEGMHFASPKRKPSQEVEPEYIAISSNSKTALVALQENNAIAVIDIEKGTLTHVKGMGFKDHRVFPMDASNKDKKINIKNWPVYGMYQPDSIYTLSIAGNDYVVTANEGDARDYDGYSEETRVGKLKLDPDAFPNAAMLQKPENLGRLKVTKSRGDTDGDGDYDKLYSYGARSFSVLNMNGEMIWDSGSFIEEKLASLMPDTFNSTNDENGSFDDRSDDKGAEPEGITAGYVNAKPYVFVGLERMGGFMIFDMSNPYAPQYVAYQNDRNYTGDPKTDTAGELAPEGMTFVKAKDSPTGHALLLVASEVSGSTAIYQLK